MSISKLPSDDLEDALTNSDIESMSICWLRFIYDNKLIHRAELLALCKDYEIENATRLTCRQMISCILNRVPVQWISCYLDWLTSSPSDALIMDLYITDKIGNNLEQDTRINQSIISAPHPDRSFTAYRAINNDPSFVEGEIYMIETVRSGSLNFIHLRKQLRRIDDVLNTILRIYIPEDSVIAYHVLEDRVIFPKDAKFRIIKESYIRDTSIGKIKFYNVVYLGI